MDPVQVVFTPSGRSGTVEAGTTVLDAARRLGVDLDTVCGGRGVCGRCQVAPGCGRFAKWGLDVSPDALGPLVSTEVDYRAHRPLGMGHRLGCAATIEHDVVIDVPASSQVHRQIVRKELGVPTFELDPGIDLYYLEVPAARLGDSDSAAALLRTALREQHPRALAVMAADDHAPRVDLHALPMLHEAIAATGGCTVAVTGSRELAPRVVAAWPGFVPAAFGIAIDVGSTTIAGHLCNLHTGEALASAGRMNPQIRFGEDLMSRVSYVMMNPGGDAELTSAVRSAVDELVTDLVDDSGVDRDQVLDMVFVGNPIMQHVLLGIDPTPLGGAPFTLATGDGVHGRATDLGVGLPHADAYVGPCIAGHVGADTSAAMLAEGTHRSEGMQLLVDIGTNAEIVLGNRDRQFAASSPTGPAFEGAQLSCGQRATTGAIERVRIDPETLEPVFKVIGAEGWSDEPGFAESLDAGEIEVAGICGSGIIDAIAEMYLAGVIDAGGTIRGELTEHSSRVVAEGRTFSYVLARGSEHAVAITQNDVRAIQLAKAALRAGIDLLVEHAGNPEIADIRLAGAFGARLDPARAMVLGLIPDCRLARVRAVGNAAGAGAVQVLLSRQRRAEMEDAVRGVTKIETATEPGFQERFVAAMAVPHATAPNPHLADEIALPPDPAPAAATTAASQGPGVSQPSRVPAAAGATGPGGRQRRRRSHRSRQPDGGGGDGENPQSEEASG